MGSNVGFAEDVTRLVLNFVKFFAGAHPNTSNVAIKIIILFIIEFQNLNNKSDNNYLE